MAVRSSQRRTDHVLVTDVEQRAELISTNCIPNTNTQKSCFAAKISPTSAHSFCQRNMERRRPSLPSPLSERGEGKGEGCFEHLAFLCHLCLCHLSFVICHFACSSAALCPFVLIRVHSWFLFFVRYNNHASPFTTAARIPRIPAKIASVLITPPRTRGDNDNTIPITPKITATIASKNPKNAFAGKLAIAATIAPPPWSARGLTPLWMSSRRPFGIFSGNADPPPSGRLYL
jgi:hypothetical protein